MKIQILLLLGTAFIAPQFASAQTKPEQPKVQLSDIPQIGELFRAPSRSNGVEFVPPQWSGELPIPLDKLPLKVQLMFDPKLPAYPRLNSAQKAGTKLRVLQTYRGPIFQAEIVRQSAGDVLRAVCAVMGVRAIIDPELDNLRYAVSVVRGAKWEDLLEFGGAEHWKSSSGTYFFAAVPSVFELQMKRDFAEAAEKNRLEREKRLADPRYDPFVLPFGGLPNPSLKGWGARPTPQPDWETREFNNHEFYYIPMPNSPQPQEQKP